MGHEVDSPTMPTSLPRSQEIGLNLHVLLFAFCVAIAVGILFGLAPALKNSKSDLQHVLKGGGLTSSSGQHHVQSTLVVVQVALTLVLLVGSGLLLRTIRHLLEVNAGFDTQHIITFKVGVSPSLTKTAASTRIAYQRLIERVRQIPGVQAADFNRCRSAEWSGWNNALLDRLAETRITSGSFAARGVPHGSRLPANVGHTAHSRAFLHARRHNEIPLRRSHR